MSARVRAFDWAATSLGPIESWRPELRSAVAHLLDSGFPGAIVWGPDRLTIYNDAFAPILGAKHDALGRPFDEIWAEAWDTIGPIADRAYAGEATFIENFPLVVNRSGAPEMAFFTFCYAPLRLADGTVGGMMDTVVETTKTVILRSDLDVLNRELGHRLKNAMTLVQAIASQTLRDVTERSLVDSFLDRIVAIGQAQEALVAAPDATADLRELARAILDPLDVRGQIAISGPSVRIGARAGPAFAMLLHELATNAVKYGALSTPAGRVDCNWTLQESALRFQWQEASGPPVSEPPRRGFGSRLIARGFGVEGTVSHQFAPDGVSVVIEAPLQSLQRG